MNNVLIVNQFFKDSINHLKFKFLAQINKISDKLNCGVIKKLEKDFNLLNQTFNNE
jgi:hypothetical protein